MARIVVIDDDRGTRRMVVRALSEVGHSVEEAVDGAEGLRLAAAAPPELAVVDILMPGRDGIETIMELRRRQPSLPILAISGGGVSLSRDDVLVDAHALGATEVLRKPFPVSDLRETISRMLRPPSV
ncbi:MAG: response regulator [Gemmatimonadaceae bacterium]